MAIFRMFADIIANLTPDELKKEGLEKITCYYTNYAYYGSRRTLEQQIRRRAEQIRQRYHGDLPEGEKLLQKWFGKDWKRDSGNFPDFVLEYEANQLVGDGAILELKDSKGKAIASFNSTFPERAKALSALPSGVLSAVHWYQGLIGKPVNSDELRDCFYVVRTFKSDVQNVRLSIVHGTFFETVEIKTLLRQVWEHLFQQAGISPEESQEILERLSNLSRSEIAITRRFEQASIKPRLRIMSEVEAEANPHSYPEIAGRTVNLIFKMEPLPRVDEVCRFFSQDGVQDVLVVSHESFSIRGKTCRFGYINHERNGTFVLAQYCIQ